MRVANTVELKNKTNELLRQVMKGEAVIVTYRGKPAASITPLSEDDLEDFVLQHSRKDAPEESLGVWKRVRLLVQGSNALSFYRRPDGTGFIQVSLNGS